MRLNPIPEKTFITREECKKLIIGIINNREIEEDLKLRQDAHHLRQQIEEIKLKLSPATSSLKQKEDTKEKNQREILVSIAMLTDQDILNIKRRVRILNANIHIPQLSSDRSNYDQVIKAEGSRFP